MDFSWKTESTIMKNATRSNRYILVSSNAQLIRSSYSDWGKNWWLWSRNIDDQTPEAIKKHPVYTPLSWLSSLFVDTNKSTTYIQYEKKHEDFLKKTKKIKNGRKQNEKYKNFLTRKNLKNYAIGKNIRKQEP